MTGLIRSSLISRLLSSLSLLRNHQSSRRRQQYNGDQSLSFHFQCRLAHGLQVRAGIMHQDQTVGVDVGKKVTNLWFAQLRQRIAEQDIDLSWHFYVQARLAAVLDPFLQA